MPKPKKSKKRGIPIPPVIVVVLTDDAEQAAAMDSITKKKKVRFDIEDVQPGSIPVVRARNHPVHL
jgi:hypothetical protein